MTTEHVRLRGWIFRRFRGLRGDDPKAKLSDDALGRLRAFMLLGQLWRDQLSDFIEQRENGDGS